MVFSLHSFIRLGQFFIPSKKEPHLILLISSMYLALQMIIRCGSSLTNMNTCNHMSSSLGKNGNPNSFTVIYPGQGSSRAKSHPQEIQCRNMPVAPTWHHQSSHKHVPYVLGMCEETHIEMVRTCKTLHRPVNRTPTRTADLGTGDRSWR